MKYILTTLLMMLSIYSFSQTPIFEPCGTKGSEQLSQAKLVEMASRRAYDPNTKYVLNVRFTMVNLDDGTNEGTNFCIQNGIPFGENDYLDIIKNLNINFNQFNIFFKYLGYETIINSNLSNIQTQQDFNPTLDALTDLSEKDAINIYFVNQITAPLNSNDYNYLHFTATQQYIYGEASMGRPIMLLGLPSYVGIYPLGNGSCQDYLMDKDFLVCHEMGHILGLQHIWANWDNIQTSNPYTLAEHVTRNTSDSNYNADHAGDFVTDTPATRSGLVAEKYTSTCILNFALETPIFSLRDIEGTPFDFNNIEYGNYMSYVYKVNNANCPAFLQIQSCTNRFFTPGQGVAMRTFIQNVPYVYTSFGTTGFSSTCLNFARNDINSLFQPYKRTNIGGDVVVTTTDNGNGTAKVCRNILAQDKFQPGFTYNFPANDAPDDINATVNDIPIVSHHTADYPVTIYQLDPTDQSINTGLAKLVCTRGVICQDEPFHRGTLYSATTLLSMNITVEELNQIQVKDPKLYDNLMSEYYYRLEKETASGAKVEQVFYKP